MENVHEKAKALKKLLAEKYGIHSDADLNRALASSRLDIGIFVSDSGKVVKSA